MLVHRLRDVIVFTSVPPSLRRLLRLRGVLVSPWRHGRHVSVPAGPSRAVTGTAGPAPDRHAASPASLAASSRSADRSWTLCGHRHTHGGGSMHADAPLPGLDMAWFDAVSRRTSRRRFSDAPVAASDLEALRRSCQAFRPSSPSTRSSLKTGRTTSSRGSPAATAGWTALAGFRRLRRPRRQRARSTAAGPGPSLLARRSYAVAPSVTRDRWRRTTSAGRPPA